MGTALGKKWLSLFMFMCQNSVNPLIFRYATTESTADARYSTVVAVGMAELLKFVLSLFLLVAEQGFCLTQTLTMLRADLLAKPWEMLKLGVPAALYMVQNSLLQISSGHLPAAVAQVIYQGKLLVTAVMSVALLQMHFTRAQWMAMAVMGLGIALVQVSGATERKQAAMGNAAEQDSVTGALLLLVACCLSAFASVYFEAIVKGVGAARGKTASLWVQNLQLALLTMALCAYSFVAAILNPRDGARSSIHLTSVFDGFTLKVWILIANNAVSGLLVALVIKHADNVLRGFASAIATILCAVLSIFCFEFEISANFFIGTLLVVGSAMLYGGVLKLRGSWWNSECTSCLHIRGVCLTAVPAKPVAPVHSPAQVSPPPPLDDLAKNP